MEDGGGATVSLENGDSLVSLGGDIGRQLKIAAAALGGSGSGGRRTCNNGIDVSVVEAKGLL